MEELDQDLETVEPESKEGEEAKSDSKTPTTVGLKPNIANSNA